MCKRDQQKLDNEKKGAAMIRSDLCPTPADLRRWARKMMLAGGSAVAQEEMRDAADRMEAGE